MTGHTVYRIRPVTHTLHMNTYQPGHWRHIKWCNFAREFLAYGLYAHDNERYLSICFDGTSPPDFPGASGHYPAAFRGRPWLLSTRHPYVLPVPLPHAWVRSLSPDFRSAVAVSRP